MVASLAIWLDSPSQRALPMRLMRRRRWTEICMLPLLLYSFSARGGHLRDVDSLERDRAVQQITALRRVNDSNPDGLERLASPTVVELRLDAVPEHWVAVVSALTPL